MRVSPIAPLVLWENRFEYRLEVEGMPYRFALATLRPLSPPGAAPF